MSSSLKALESLTATYTDSENEEDSDNRIETAMDLESDEDEKKIIEEAMSSYPLKEDHTDNDDDLPPEPSGTCAPELQEKVSKMFHKVKNEGLDLNKEIQSKKSFRNPSIYEKLIDFCGLNEFGTNYPPEKYDPLKWGKESYYDELAQVQSRLIEEREKNKKTKVEIVSGTAKKVTVTNGTTATSQTTNSILDGEKRRKTKWDQTGNPSQVR